MNNVVKWEHHILYLYHILQLIRVCITRFRSLAQVTNGLTIAERRQYGLRRTIEKDGVLYAAYFGRKLQLDRGNTNHQCNTCG